MARKGRTTEEIIAVLREAEVRIGQGETVGKICRSLGISEQTYYKWRREYGGLKLDQAKQCLLTIAPVATSSVRSDIVARDEIVNGSRAGRGAYFKSSARLTLSIST